VVRTGGFASKARPAAASSPRSATPRPQLETA
jgi:hypothetical protein